MDLPSLPLATHSAGGGLDFVVSEKGHRMFRYRATVPGTRKRREKSNYPDMTLDVTRRERDRRRVDAKSAHARNMTPVVPKIDRDMTVRVVAELWIGNHTNTGRRKSLSYPSSVQQRLKDAPPARGHPRLCQCQGLSPARPCQPEKWDRLQHPYPAVADIHTTKHVAAIEPEDAPALMAKIRADHDLISAALCHKSETEMDEVYNRGT